MPAPGQADGRGRFKKSSVRATLGNKAIGPSMTLSNLGVQRSGGPMIVGKILKRRVIGGQKCGNPPVPKLRKPM